MRNLLGPGFKYVRGESPMTLYFRCDIPEGIFAQMLELFKDTLSFEQVLDLYIDTLNLPDAYGIMIQHPTATKVYIKMKELCEIKDELLEKQ